MVVAARTKTPPMPSEVSALKRGLTITATQTDTYRQPVPSKRLFCIAAVVSGQYCGSVRRYLAVGVSVGVTLWGHP